MDPTTQWVLAIVSVSAFGLGLLAGRDLKAVFTVKEIRAQLDWKIEAAIEHIGSRATRELRSIKFRS